MAFTGYSVKATLSGSAPGGAPRQVKIVDMVWGTNGYAAGGKAIAASDVGLTAIDGVFTAGAGATGAGNTGLVPHWDRVSGKLKMYKGVAAANPFTECVAADTDGLTTTIIVVGQ